MRMIDLGPLPLTIIASLVVAVVLLALRVVLLQRVHRQRQRENRQETERLKSLAAAYRAIAGSFSPPLEEHAMQLEGTLADVVLFGTLRQVELAADCVAGLKRGDAVDYQPLIEEMRSDLRIQLGLEPIPATLVLPRSGPKRGPRFGRADSGRGAGGGGGGGVSGELGDG